MGGHLCERRGVILEVISTLMTEPSIGKDLQTSKQDLAKVYLPLAVPQPLPVLLSNALTPFS